ncbi:MAG: hypothetical protein UI647_09460 [Negativibacillus sp.]
MLIDSAGINLKQSQQQRFQNINRNRTAATEPKLNDTETPTDIGATNKIKSNGKCGVQTITQKYTQLRRHSHNKTICADSDERTYLMSKQSFKRVRVDFRGPYISLNFHLAKLAIAKKDPLRTPVPADWFGCFFTPNGCWHQNQKIKTNFLFKKIPSTACNPIPQTSQKPNPREIRTHQPV